MCVSTVHFDFVPFERLEAHSADCSEEFNRLLRRMYDLSKENWSQIIVLLGLLTNFNHKERTINYSLANI